MYRIILSTGSSLSDQVHQTPADIFTKPGEEAQINCLHSINSYDQILWYKQLQDRKLQFLGYMYYNKEYLEAGAGVTIDGSADKDQNCTLTIERLNQSSSAVYFCAASYHSAAYHCSSVQKPPHHSVFISVLWLTAPYTWDETL